MEKAGIATPSMNEVQLHLSFLISFSTTSCLCNVNSWIIFSRQLSAQTEKQPQYLDKWLAF